MKFDDYSDYSNKWEGDENRSNTLDEHDFTYFIIHWCCCVIQYTSTLCVCCNGCIAIAMAIGQYKAEYIIDRKNRIKLNQTK